MDSENKVKVYVVLKHMGNITKKLKEQPFILNSVPHTLGELIEEFVRICLDLYKKRALDAENPTPINDEQFEGYKEIGKFVFGVHYNQNEPDEVKSIQTAKEAVADGIVRVFKGNEELVGLDSAIKISEGDVFTFIKLAMLSGRMW